MVEYYLAIKQTINRTVWIKLLFSLSPHARDLLGADKRLLLRGDRRKRERDRDGEREMGFYKGFVTHSDSGNMLH